MDKDIIIKNTSPKGGEGMSIYDEDILIQELDKAIERGEITDQEARDIYKAEKDAIDDLEEWQDKGGAR